MSTIVAISTSPGIGGIGIIRLSGDDSFNIINKIFKPKNNSDIKGYSIKYGVIVDEKNEVIDEVLVSYFISPKSYTTENMCEINSHGGIVVMNKIIDLCLRNGAEMAEPGEFTKRAFLNGRMDLSQAEAVIDIINSKTDKESKVAIQQLEGDLSEKVENIRKKVISILADIEANIDYPEYDVEETSKSKISLLLDEVDILLQKLEKTFYNGKILREGVKVSIVGKPNAGKSSILNLMLNEERAIVTNIEGTTRDSIEEFININGIPVKIIDTAGIRNAKDEVEKIGVEKSIKLIDESDIVLAVFDISRELDKEDKKILDLIKDKEAIIVLNKNDLNCKINKNDIECVDKTVIEISAKNKDGIDKIFDSIYHICSVDGIANDGETIVSNNRHKSAIIKALQNVEIAKKTLDNNMPVDIISTNLKEIIEELGKITGQSVTEDLINEIFSKFCLGK